MFRVYVMWYLKHLDFLNWESVSVPKPAESSSEFLRAENEDDDGYDPYSDRHEESPLFEPDPWK